MTPPQTLTIRCPNCQTKNRVPADRIHEGPKCGKCHMPLPTGGRSSGKPLTVTDATFRSEVLEANRPVLMDCWADWCGPCRMVGPVIEELASEWRGRIVVAKLNTDENPKTAATYGIRSIPTLLVFERGQLRDTIVGAVPKAELVRRMTPYL